MKAFEALFIAILFALSLSIAAPQNPPATGGSPLDLNVLLNSFKDPGWTTLEKQALKGMRYSGH